jgi:hypothetical protein
MKLLGIAALVGVAAYASWIMFWLVFGPSTEEAMQISLKLINVPGLATAYAIHPDACSIKRTGPTMRTVECEGLPMHHYQNVKYCEGREGQAPCAPATSLTDCRSYYWDIDLRGTPSAPIGDLRTHASIMSECHSKASFDADRAEMERRSIEPSAFTINVPRGSLAGRNF